VAFGLKITVGPFKDVQLYLKRGQDGILYESSGDMKFEILTFDRCLSLRQQNSEDRKFDVILWLRKRNISFKVN
jgi:hypothetical protein